MKPILCFFSVIILCVGAQAQSPTPIPLENTKGYPILDTAQYTVRYGLSYKRNPKEKRSRYQELNLQVGHRYNRFFYAPKLKPDEKSLNKGVELNKNGDGLATTVILVDQKEQKRIVTVRPQARKTFTYTEAITYPEWEMISGEQTILEFPCKQSRTTYLGRTYTAWYTLEMPMSIGPWKFGGLPGLILKVEDDKGEYIFECIEIKKTLGEPIMGVNPNAKPIERIQLEKYIKNLHKNFGKIVVSDGAHITIVNKDGSLSDGSQISFAYNPIEKE